MKALVTAPGNTAAVAELAVPEPAANEIRVKVCSIGLNTVDAYYVAHPAAPPGRVVGSDIAGTVDKVGAAVVGWSVGDRVAGFLQGATSGNSRPGGFAEYATLEADLAIHIPSAVSFEQAATISLCSLTAAQAIFIRLGVNPPFKSPFAQPDTAASNQSPAILVYSASTSLGMFAIDLLRIARTPAGKPYRIFATASPKNHAKLREKGVEAVFDYRSVTWIADVREASGGISGAFDCISEGQSTAQISQTFGESGGTIAVVRKPAMTSEGIKSGITAIYSAVWFGLGHEIVFSGVTIPAEPLWRAFAVEYFKFLSSGSRDDPSHLPIEPTPVRLMPGGLEKVVQGGFALLGGAGVLNRTAIATEPWMKPISGEKLVYRIG